MDKISSYKNELLERFKFDELVKSRRCGHCEESASGGTRQSYNFKYLQTTRLLRAVYPALDAGLAMTGLRTFYEFIKFPRLNFRLAGALKILIAGVVLIYVGYYPFHRNQSANRNVRH